MTNRIRFRNYMGILFVLFLISACTIPKEPSATTGDLKQFKTAEELNAFIKETQSLQQNYNNYGGILFAENMQRDSNAPQPITRGNSAVSGKTNTGSDDYSQTNIQVAGVDEADFVKNDGEYIYLIQNEKVLIIDAHPPTEAKIIAEIKGEGAPQNLFVDKEKLVVLSTYYGMSSPGMAEIVEDIPVEAKIAPGFIRPIPQRETTRIHIYDISSRENPILLKTYSAPGYFYQGRMKNGYAYLVTQQSLNYNPGYPIPLPAIKEGDQIRATSPIFYFDVYMPNLVFSSIVSLNLGDLEDISLHTYMIGYGNTFYMSEKNMYVAHQKDYPYAYYRQQQEDPFFTVVYPLLPSHIREAIDEVEEKYADPLERIQRTYEVYQELYNQLDEQKRVRFNEEITAALAEHERKIQEERQRTVIHKFSIEGSDVEYEGKGEVKGQLLNQFSLDEYEDYLRVATTLYFYGTQTTSTNNIYTIDGDLDVAGSLEDIAPGERIYSARFIGKRLYLVTFKQVDPFFVIDLADPEQPTILGALKIPGFSDYLHPYDENHIIGVGKETKELSDGRVQTDGLKLALFDVADVHNPKQRAKYMIGGQGTHSEALYDHKAFLFAKNKNLLALPVQEMQENDWQNIWYGVYVFDLTSEQGFVLKGKVDHTPPRKQPADYSYNQVRRSLYIGDALYTLSQQYLKANSLLNLSQEYVSIKLPQQQFQMMY